jgi:hypothetical protein
MLNQNIFNYKEERKEALACHNVALWFKLYIEEQQKEKNRQEYYFNKFLEDDHNRCTRGF